MNRRRLQDVEATYGEGWEQTADLIHPLIAAAEAEIFTDGFCDERLDNPFELKMHSLTIDFSGAVENATRRSAELKAGIDARMAEAKERNKGQYSPLK